MPKPRRGQSVAIDVAGAEAAIQGHAQQAIATEVLPGKDASPDDWATYINAARGRAAEAVIEWGCRIAAAHSAYKAQPQRWGQTWENWCQQNLGIGKSYADRLRLIGENLALTKCQILPAGTDQLTLLARLRQQDPAAFDAAVAQGTINPQLTRQQAQDLLQLAKGAQVQSPLLAFPAPFRRVAGVTFEVDLADKLEAIAQHRGTTPAQLLAEVAGAWLKRQPMPEGAVTVDTTVQASE